jgi:hypothetical protein
VGEEKDVPCATSKKDSLSAYSPRTRHHITPYRGTNDTTVNQLSRLLAENIVPTLLVFKLRVLRFGGHDECWGEGSGSSRNQVARVAARYDAVWAFGFETVPEKQSDVAGSNRLDPSGITETTVIMQRVTTSATRCTGKSLSQAVHRLVRRRGDREGELSPRIRSGETDEDPPKVIRGYVDTRAMHSLN